jgi:hypothetical protein
MADNRHRWELIKRAEAYASLHKQALDIGVNDNTLRDLGIGAAAGGALGLGKHLFMQPDEDEDEERSSLLGDVGGGALLGAGAGGIYNQTLGAPALQDPGGYDQGMRDLNTGVGTHHYGPEGEDRIIIDGDGGEQSVVDPEYSYGKPPAETPPAETPPAETETPAEEDEEPAPAPTEPAPTEPAPAPTEPATEEGETPPPAAETPPAAEEAPAQDITQSDYKIDPRTGEILFWNSATGEYEDGLLAGTDDGRVRAPEGASVVDGKLVKLDGTPVMRTDTQPINLPSGGAAVDPSTLPPGTTTQDGLQSTNRPHLEGVDRKTLPPEYPGSTNPGNPEPTNSGNPEPTNPGAQPNYGFDVDESTATDEPGGGLAIYPGADTTGFGGTSGFRLQRIYNERARDAEAEKRSGFYSEMLSGLNPLNLYGGTLVGSGAALTTPTRDLKQQAEADQDMWKNILVPGVGPYNAMKRIGTSIRGPELKEERGALEAAQAEAKRSRKEKRDGDGDGMVNDGTPEEKSVDTPEEKAASFLRDQLESMELGHRLAHSAMHGVEKVADVGQAVDAPLGSMQQAYVADAVGADAQARAAKQVVEHDEADDGLYNALVAQAMGAAGPIHKRVRHGASRFAESAGKRMVNRFDPTQMLSENPDATLTGLAMGTGKINPEREDLVAQRYKEVLKKYQAKLDPDAELTERDTPWHRGMQGNIADLDSDIAGHKYMRAEKPWEYWLNPFDKSGPLTELGDRGMRRMIAAQAYPDSTAGRVGMAVGGVGTLGLLPLLAGGEDAQQSLRRSAAENEIYADVANPELINRPRDGDGDGMINDGTPEEKEAAIDIRDITPGNTAIVAGLLGGGLGALGGAGSALYSGRGEDEDEKPSVINRALLGALAGGGLGAAGGYLGADSLRNYVGETVLDEGNMNMPGLDDLIDAFADSRQPPKEVQSSAKKKKKKKRNRRKVLVGPGGKAEHRPYKDDEEEEKAAHLQSIISRGTAQFLGREEKQAARPGGTREHESTHAQAARPGGTREHESTHADAGRGKRITKRVTRQDPTPNPNLTRDQRRRSDWDYRTGAPKDLAKKPRPGPRVSR